MANQATSAPAPGDPNYDAYQAQQNGWDINDPLYQLTKTHHSAVRNLNREPSKAQIDALRNFFKSHNLSRDDQVKVVDALISRSENRDEAVSVQETLDLAKDTVYTPQEWANERAGVHVEPRPTVAGQGQPAEGAKAPTTSPQPLSVAPQAPSAAQVPATPTAQDDIPQNQWDEMSAELGYDAKAAWQQQKARWQQANQFHLPYGIPVQPPTAYQWAAQMRTSIEGAYGPVLDQLASDWELAHNSPMPSELRQQVLARLKSAPASLNGHLITAMSQRDSKDANTAASANAMFDSLVKQYETDVVVPYADTHLTETDLGRTQGKELGNIMNHRVTEYIDQFGNRPLPADAKDWGNMTQTQWDDFLGNQPYKLGMNKKAYDAAAAQISSKWQSAFGVPASESVIAWAAGKSADEVTRYIDSQPSRKSGMNVGQYNAVVKAGDSISNDLWGHPMDDHLIGLVWGGVSKNNPRANPAAAPQLQGTTTPPPVPSVSTLNPSTPTRDTGLGSTLPVAP